MATYVMVAQDSGAAPPGYVTWIATTYDSAGAGYAGGTPVPIGAMVGGSAFCLAYYRDHEQLHDLDSASDHGSCTITEFNTLLTDATLVGKSYGGFWAYNKSIPFNIATANVYHGFCQVLAGDLTQGTLSGWTFYAGRIVSSNITNELNPSGNILQIEYAGVVPDMATGDIVTLSNMNNAAHNGVTKITWVSATKFNCDNIPYVAGAGASAGVVIQPAYLKAGAAAAGVYMANFVIDGTAAGANKDWKWELNIEILPADNVVTERRSTSTLTSVSSNGIITIAANDRVWLSGKNITDTTDYNVKNMNLNVHRIG